MLTLLNTSLIGLEEIGHPSTPVERGSAERLKKNFKYAMGQLQDKFDELSQLSERPEPYDEDEVKCIAIGDDVSE